MLLKQKLLDKQIKPCPCGAIPKELLLYDANQGSKYAFVQGDCCGEWMIEFRSNYLDLESDECKELALLAWNGSSRKP